MSAASAGSRTVALAAEGARALDELLARRGAAPPRRARRWRPGCAVLGEREEARDRWLAEDVVPTHDAMARDPGRGLSPDAVADALAAHHAARRAGGA